MFSDRRILIADDNPGLRAGLIDLLHDMQLHIVEADTGLIALDILRGQSLDLALLDMHMPGRTGLELLSMVRRETLGIPCIFFSADATLAIQRQALEEGAFSVLCKPLEPLRLRMEVRRALESAPPRTC